ncbi:MAG: SH3 domain-containing protein [Desulfobacteraceae bacterium]
MPWLRCLALSVLVLMVWGCTMSAPAVIRAPVKRPLYYYVGAMEVPLRGNPDPQSKVTAQVTLNERVEKLDQSPNGWFKVVTSDRRFGWASERYFKVDPVTEFYVIRSDSCLRSSPNEKARAVANLRLNDQVQLSTPHPRQGWVQVQVQRNHSQGWMELKDLSLDQVEIRRRTRRPPAGRVVQSKEEAADSAKEAPSSPPALAPTPAQAAPSPAENGQPVRKARPERFDRF